MNSEKEFKNEAKPYKRALLHSGGNARGAVAVPVLEYLERVHGHKAYSAYGGVSVGAVNVPEFASGNVSVLRSMYESVDSVWWYLKLRAPWKWNKGFTSISRLREKIEANGTCWSELPLDRPIYFGIYNYEDDLYHSFNHLEAKSKSNWMDARLASACIPIVMTGQDVDIPGIGKKYCYDGGMKCVIPDLPDWQSYTDIDVILCSPIERSNYKNRKEVEGLLNVASRTIDIWIDNTVERDLERLQMWANAGVNITIYAPRESGGSFNASKEAMQKRLKEGEWMVKNPVKL